MLKEPKIPFYRLFVDEHGKVFVTFEPRKEIRDFDQEVNPITPQDLKAARERVFAEVAARQPLTPDVVKRIELRRKACQELVGVLDPLQAPRLWPKVAYLAQLLVAWLIALPGLVLIVTLPFKGLLAARESLPEPFFLLSLGIFALLLIVGLLLISKARRSVDHTDMALNRPRFLEQFSALDLIFFLGLVFTVGLAVFTALTLVLHEHKWVILETCGHREVSMGSISDFYLWHFLDLVPLVKVNAILKWQEPLCYSQTRIGLLILLFQGFVVIPCIAGVSSFWKKRHLLSRRDYAFDPEWLPGR